MLLYVSQLLLSILAVAQLWHSGLHAWQAQAQEAYYRVLVKSPLMLERVIRHASWNDVIFLSCLVLSCACTCACDRAGLDLCDSLLCF